MKICFPIRDLDGKEFTSVDEVMSLINSEPHGGWLLGANGMWHGGIHISDVTQPHSALNNGAQDYGDPVPLQFMADGTIVAYRLNDVYQTAPYCSKPLRYSSSFALVKSLCQPDPKNEASWLEFYTLYMRLAAMEDYPTSPCYKVSDGRTGISLRKYRKGQHCLAEGESQPAYSAALNAPAAVRSKVVNEGDRFVVSRTGRFYVTRNNKPTLLTFGLSRLLKEGKASDEQYWITLDPDLVERDGEMHNLMPEWMHQAKARGTFNSVVNTDGSAAWQVKAGTPVGFMGLNEVPGTAGGSTEQERFVHLEVLSTDSRMPGFLSNPGKFTTAGKLIRTLSGRKIWLRSEATPPVFTATDITLNSGSLVSRESTTPFKDTSDKWWFKVSDHGWMPQGDVEEIEQYDLLKQGFHPMVEENDGDMQDSFLEGWIPELFGRIAEFTEKNKDGPTAGRVTDYYRSLMARLDENGDGNLSADEVRRGLGRRAPAIRDIVDRLVVKHHSEWIGGPSEARWKGFYKILDKLSIPYCTQWQSGQEWMSQVEAFKAGKPAWHMHPVLFLNSIKERGLSIQEARVRAFMRMLRVGEGTIGEKGYEILFGGQSFIKDYSKSFDDHPKILITRGGLSSTAAGAYQVMGYTWDDRLMTLLRKKENIQDFSPISQDRFCVLIFKYKRKGSLSEIMAGNIRGALDKLSYEWASLPPGRYGQPAKTMDQALSLYDKYLSGEVSGISDLHLEQGYITEISER
ncbi:glycoside hydrolase family 24 protein [Type-D symbiont of Plautia stali]|uniref:glycoside hydrolase family 24 protein n=1 Tax=Type-D symbiont of Plautia stali TaxID=1560356 RepID=UPI000AB696E8|nr:glycoside hydrolase family 104 protein [Type-D symbiont of Plautia stali]